MSEKAGNIINSLAGYFEQDAKKKPVVPQQPAKPADPAYGEKARQSIKDALKIK